MRADPHGMLGDVPPNTPLRSAGRRGQRAPARAQLSGDQPSRCCEHRHAARLRRLCLDALGHEPLRPRQACACCDHCVLDGALGANLCSLLCSFVLWPTAGLQIEGAVLPMGELPSPPLLSDATWFNWIEYLHGVACLPVPLVDGEPDQGAQHEHDIEIGRLKWISNFVNSLNVGCVGKRLGAQFCM